MAKMPCKIQITMPMEGQPAEKRTLDYVACSGFKHGNGCRGGAYRNEAGDCIEFTAKGIVIELADNGEDDGKVLDLSQPLVIQGLQ